MHQTASVKSALAQLTNLDYCHDDVLHPELRKSRAKRDFRDLSKVLDFLEMHNPFDTSDERLRSLTSGIVASESDNILCDIAEDVGAKILKKMNGEKLKSLVLKRVDQIRTLAHVSTTVTRCKKLLNLDPSILFNRLFSNYAKIC